MNYEQQAIKLFNEGYNCSQAIVLAFKDLLLIEEKSLESLSSSLGGGISRLREVCGCISGMGIVFGLLYGNYDKNDDVAKGNHYELIQKISLKFKNEMKSYLCHELLNIDNYPSNPKAVKRTKDYYKTRPCAKYIGYMAKIMAEEIDNYG